MDTLVAERLIVAADFDPDDYDDLWEVQDAVIHLAKTLQGMGVYIKVNSILRAIGYDLIQVLHELGLKVFADLKLNDIPNTMRADAKLLKPFAPEILTVMCNADVAGMRAVQEVLEDVTEVLGVTVLTSIDDFRCNVIYGSDSEPQVLRFAMLAEEAKLGGLILSPLEAAMIRQYDSLNSLSLNTPGIRPAWSVVKSDDQARVMTPTKAIQAGTKRVVIGRPIVQAESPREAVIHTLAEIEEALNS